MTHRFDPAFTAAPAVSNFDFHNHPVCVVTIDGTPWFVSRDVVEVLGYARVDNALRPLNDEERLVLKPSDPRQMRSVGDFRLIFGNPARNASLISESGLYKLIMRSDKPTAKPFQDWVTKVVLPAIRAA